MADYAFYTDEFGVDEHGIHLLRNRFRYHTFRYEEIRQLRVRRGPDIQNWGGMLAFGILLLLAGLGSLAALYWFFTEGEGHIELRLVVVPFFPLLLGGLAVYSALRRTVVLEIWQQTRPRRVSLRAIVQAGQLHELITHLRTRHRTLEVAPEAASTGDPVRR